MKSERELQKGLYFVHGYYLSDMRDDDVSDLYRDQLILLKDSMEDMYEIDAYDINLRELHIKDQTEFPEGEFVYYDGKEIQLAIDNPTSINNTNLNEQLRNTILPNSDLNKPIEVKRKVSEVNSYHINVGHGNCSIIVFKVNESYNMWMVDCSIFDFTDGKDYRQNLEDCLREVSSEFKIKKISKLMITHLHYDHINGIEYLIEKEWIDANSEVWMNIQYPWKQATYNRILQKLNNLKVRFIDPICNNSTKNIKILYPSMSFNNKNKAPNNKINNASVLYHICFNGKSMLFTGDIETEGWNDVSTCMMHLCNSTYYCISHHGSITGHIRNKCLPAKMKISTIADCAKNTKLQILMGRDGAYKGVYNRKVLEDFKSIVKTERAKNYLKLEWDSGNYQII